MKFTSAPSPNHDVRTLPISLLVLHYTGMKSGKAALAHMRDPASKVSAHYMVEENGHVFKLVEEDRRAWHAGVSSWGGETNINSASIGIEIVNGGHDYGLPDFPDAQIKAVIRLCRDIMKRNGISNFGILAHSDIAPGRKQDPGEKFPWAKLADAGVGIWPDVKTKDPRLLFGENTSGKGIAILQTALAYLGYDVQANGKIDAHTRCVIRAFQRRYRAEKIDGLIDVQTLEILTLLARYTKKKNEGATGVG
ncbi:MAG: N-acetylmuramoyl-L-alanine amidase [Robiginitomaculum sp.]|nr:N-acetylmuramoyl-L-alanine amidase [Robiginitomaculum sp.]